MQQQQQSHVAAQERVVRYLEREIETLERLLDHDPLFSAAQPVNRQYLFGRLDLARDMLRDVRSRGIEDL